MNDGGKLCGQKQKGDSVRTGIFFGGTLVIVGTAFLLSHLDLLGGMKAWQLWPCILILVALLNLAQKKIVAGLIMGSVGATVQLHYAGIIQIEWGMIWPAVIILVGLVVFIASVRRTRKRRARHISADFFESSIVLGGRQEEVSSQQFEGGEISCVMAGLELNMTNARLKEGEATLMVKLVMGGLELKVPQDWVVVSRGNPVMGGFENKTRLSPSVDASNAPRLIIDGSVFMGGVEISN